MARLSDGVDEDVDGQGPYASEDAALASGSKLAQHGASPIPGVDVDGFQPSCISQPPGDAIARSQCFRRKIGISENARNRCNLIRALTRSSVLKRFYSVTS